MGTVARVRHRGRRAGWLRAAVLGANDGIVSVASVAIGVIAAGASTSFVLTAAIAALVAGAMAMAAGEYVSVSSQRDVERADLDQERGELKAHPEGEKQELAAIYVKRGLPIELARKVADALTAADALGAHARDELGMAAILARPVQAALYSALSFTAGAVLPIVAFLLVPTTARTAAVVVSALLALVALGIAGARAGGAPMLRAAVSLRGRRIGNGGHRRGRAPRWWDRGIGSVQRSNLIVSVFRGLRSYPTRRRGDISTIAIPIAN